MWPHREIDLKNPKTNRKNAGFTDEERGKFTDLLAAGFIDTFRYFYIRTRRGIYSWWSYRFKAREKNAGWRIDYFCVSESSKGQAGICGYPHGGDGLRPLSGGAGVKVIENGAEGERGDG